MPSVVWAAVAQPTTISTAAGKRRRQTSGSSWATASGAETIVPDSTKSRAVAAPRARSTSGCQCPRSRPAVILYAMRLLTMAR
jgi:hypothetical protein